MFPVLFSLGGYPIYGYGFFIALGFLLAVAFIRYVAPQKQLLLVPMLDITFWAVLTGFLGARLFYIFTRWDEYRETPQRILQVWEGGFVFYGGVIFALPIVVLLLKYYKIKVARALDVYAPALALAHSLGRVGCLSVGCCHGSVLAHDGGVLSNFPSIILKESDYVDSKYLGIPLHPVQIYESVSLFILFLFLTGLLFRKKYKEGQIALLYLLFYSVIRFFLEYLRGDEIRGFIIDPWLSTSQFVSAVVLFGFFVFFSIQKFGPILKRKIKKWNR